MSYKHTAVAIILAGIATGTVIALVGTFLWAQTWTALGVVFLAAALLFIIPVVIVIVASGLRS